MNNRKRPRASRLFSFAFALLLLAVQGSALPADEAAAPGGQKPETLRVLSYNIHMWQISVDDLAAVVKRADADIVGLNEAWNESQNEAIARELGYNVIYGGRNPKRQLLRKPHTVNGFYMPQVLLTKHKIVESQVFNAMAAKDHKAFDPTVPIYRGGTLAVLETAKGNRVVVFVLHLHPWSGGEDERMTTMRLEEIKGILKKLARYKNLPTILIGDFNTRSHLDTKGGWKVTRHLADNGFTDLYRTVKPDPQKSPGITCGEDGRIDYIFTNGQVKAVDAKVLTKGVLNSGGYEHSDHLGIFGVVRIDGVNAD